jgi:hypothetical protein
MKIYLAGAISGRPNYNADAFYTTEAKLVAEGHTVLNPLRQDKALGIDTKQATFGAGDWSVRKKVIKADLDWILTEADQVHVLPNSRHSLGVKAEIAVSRCCGIKVVFLKDKTKTRKPKQHQDKADQQAAEKELLSS